MHHPERVRFFSPLNYRVAVSQPRPLQRWSILTDCTARIKGNFFVYKSPISKNVDCGKLKKASRPMAWRYTMLLIEFFAFDSYTLWSVYILLGVRIHQLGCNFLLASDLCVANIMCLEGWRRLPTVVWTNVVFIFLTLGAFLFLFLFPFPFLLLTHWSCTTGLHFGCHHWGTHKNIECVRAAAGNIIWVQ